MRNAETIAVTITVILLAAVFAFAYLRNKKLKENGFVADRRSDFAHWQYSYSLKSTSMEQIIAALNEIDYDAIKIPKISFNTSSGNGVIIEYNDKLAPWNAVLRNQSTDNQQSTYSFSFAHWPGNETITMGIFLTALEKMFLELDWNTSVKTTEMQVTFR